MANYTAIWNAAKVKFGQDFKKANPKKGLVGKEDPIYKALQECLKKIDRSSDIPESKSPASISLPAPP